MLSLHKMFFKMAEVTLICLSMLWLAKAAVINQQPMVETSLGSIQGRLIQVPESKVVKDVYEFLGIPYAQSPVGKLRFKKPEPVQPWTGVLQATTWPGICVQTSKLWEVLKIPAGGEPTEDCLYLNVWTPELPTAQHNPKKAVMVFIHGGGYVTGSASQKSYHGAALSSMGDVVVVTMNYRLGILGFLNAGTEEAPGNQGLWDQNLALLWVQQHIEHFGGDPNSVTIFGESAGSMSVGTHILSPKSRGLFHRAIMESGSPLNPSLIGTPEMGHIFTMQYAREQGCHESLHDTRDEDDIKEIIDCLRKIDMSRVSQSEDDYNTHPEKLYIYPTHGDEFFPVKSNTENHPVDLLIGFNTNEGSIFIFMTTEKLKAGKNGTAPLTLTEAEMIAKSYLARASENVIEHAIQFYFGKVPEDATPETLKQVTSDLLGDYLLSCPAVYYAESLSKHNTVYFYHFSHRHSGSPLEEWVGVAHGDELSYIFQESFVGYDVVFTEEEKKFRDEMVNLWTTFAKTGKPQVPGVDNWPPFTEDRPEYVDLQLTFTTGVGPRRIECNFWRCYLPKP